MTSGALWTSLVCMMTCGRLSPRTTPYPNHWLRRFPPSNGAASVTRARAGGAPVQWDLALRSGCVVDSYDGCAGLASCAPNIGMWHRARDATTSMWMCLMRMACAVGAPVYVLWRDGRHELTTEAKPGEESAANFPMYAAGSAYTLSLGSIPTRCREWDLGILRHRIRAIMSRTTWSSSALWRRQPAPRGAGDPTTVYVPIVETTPVTVTPVTVTPEQSEANWQRAYPFVLNMEGGLSTDRNDKGNYTPSGEFKGTKFGIVRTPYPHLDIANPTREQALDIYRRDYWEPSGLLLRRGRCAWRL